MKALTVRQPWADMLKWGTKRVETRSWATGYRGPVAIHAGKKFGPAERAAAMRFGLPIPGIPFGCIVAVGLLVDCFEITESLATEWGAGEVARGDWTPGRYGWALDRVRAVDGPALKGRLGLWDIPEEFAAEVRA